MGLLKTEYRKGYAEAIQDVVKLLESESAGEKEKATKCTTIMEHAHRYHALGLLDVRDLIKKLADDIVET